MIKDSHVHPGGKFRAFALFVVHLAVATIGTMALSGFLAFAVLPKAHARELLTAIPYFPLQVSLAFLIGFLLQLLWQQRAMKWIWTIPTLLLFFGLFLTRLPLGERVDRFFGDSCRIEDRCFDQTGLTLPCYASLAYSAAAWFASRVRQQTKGRPQLL